MRDGQLEQCNQVNRFNCGMLMRDVQEKQSIKDNRFNCGMLIRDGQLLQYKMVNRFKCGDEIYTEIRNLYNITYCDHCTNDFDKFCDVCKKRWDDKRISICTPNEDPLVQNFLSINYVKRYGVSYVEELTAELVAKVYGDRCECDLDCECEKLTRKQIKDKYNLSLTLYEVYDAGTDYCVIKCIDCMYNKGISIDKGRINL